MSHAAIFNLVLSKYVIFLYARPGFSIFLTIKFKKIVFYGSF